MTRVWWWAQEGERWMQWSGENSTDLSGRLGSSRLFPVSIPLVGLEPGAGPPKILHRVCIRPVLGTGGLRGVICVGNWGRLGRGRNMGVLPLPLSTFVRLWRLSGGSGWRRVAESLEFLRGPLR